MLCTACSWRRRKTRNFLFLPLLSLCWLVAGFVGVGSRGAVLSLSETPSATHGISSAACSREQAGIIVWALDCRLAEQSLQDALQARKRFAIRFGVRPGKGAVADVGIPSSAYTLPENTEWILKWPLARSSSKSTSAGGIAITFEGGLAHELGHEWFTTYLWPATKGDQYGGDAPDWLDELAAIVTEPPADAARNAQAMAALAGMAPCRLAPLFAATHPMLAAARKQAGSETRTKEGEKQQVVTFTMRANGAGPDNPLVFYGQIRALARFIMEKAPKPEGIFGRLARALKAGRNFGDWLIAEGLAKATDPRTAEEEFETAWCAAEGWNRNGAMRK